MTLPEPPSGRIDGRVHRIAVRAYFEDTDLSGVVYHANYLRWFERGRSDFVRLLGIDQRAASEGGDGAFAVAEITVRYRSPARLDDAVVIETEAVTLGAASCRMRQSARVIEHGAPGRILADADVRVGFVAADGRPRRMPLPWRTAFAVVAPVQDTE
ncbi:YbgC/FadM family acyl-CoA thioesterase [Parablastomonas sp. CN1-191]|uniref:YbgC/FadM family acyl-CoA thioesterase n=1 Tax=Parablastomonas sp. CN1-191 TaxID=3400908 RepID=UPI003BF87E2A